MFCIVLSVGGVRFIIIKCGQIKPSATEKLSMVDRAKALEALMARVEEGATDGDRFSGTLNSSPYETKRELVKYGYASC